MSQSLPNDDVPLVSIKFLPIDEVDAHTNTTSLQTDASKADYSPQSKITKYHNITPTDTLCPQAAIRSERNNINYRRRGQTPYVASTTSGDSISVDRSSSSDPKECSRGSCGEDSSLLVQANTRRSNYAPSENPFSETFYENVEKFLSDNNLYILDKDDLKNRSIIFNRVQASLIHNNHQSALKGLSEGKSTSPSGLVKLNLSLKPSNSENSHNVSIPVSMANIGGSTIFQRRNLSNSQPGCFNKAATTILPSKSLLAFQTECRSPFTFKNDPLLKEIGSNSYPKTGIKINFCEAEDLSITSTTNNNDDAESSFFRMIKLLTPKIAHGDRKDTC